MTALEQKLRHKFPNAPESFFRRQLADALAMRAPQVGAGTRLRQDPKPLLNCLETEWWEMLKGQHPNYPRPRPQAKRYKIGNGAWFKPDFTASSWPVPDGPAQETAWECKGPEAGKNVARGKLAIKTAATQFPEVCFWLVWKEAGQWRQQRVLP